jgi:radical SAM superfamily enzyme YgiQ (UPF0313 family)
MKPANYKILLISSNEGENLGIKSISAFLMLKGIDNLVIPYEPEKKETLVHLIKESNPAIIGFSLTYQRMFADFAELIVYLRHHGVKTHFTMGGHFPTIESIKILEYLPELDSIIRGEGEITLVELFRKINFSFLWGNIDGLCYRDEMGKIKVNNCRKLIENLDELPIPDRGKPHSINKNLKTANLLSSRGCYYSCSFCTNQSFFSDSPDIHRRSRSPQSVVKEMEYLHYAKGVNVFNFEGDDFLVNNGACRDWAFQFIDELKEKKLVGKIAWKMSCRINDIDKEILSEFKSAGLIGIYLDIESGNNTNLQMFNKRYSTDDFYKAVDILDQIGLAYELSLMLLNPNSTIETLKDDLKFIKRLSTSESAVIHFSKMIPYTGTPLFNQLLAEDRITGTFSSPDYHYTDSRIELLELILHKAFHYRNNDENGLVSLLRNAKSEWVLINTFSPGAGSFFYFRNIKPLIKEANQQLTDTISAILDLVSSLSYDEILNYWTIIENIVETHIEKEQKTTYLLNELLGYQTNYHYSEIC